MPTIERHSFPLNKIRMISIWTTIGTILMIDNLLVDRTISEINLMPRNKISTVHLNQNTKKTKK
jgi:hypothetical protein